MLNLIIVGDAESGKTSLMKKLSQRKRLPEDEISICNWELQLPPSDGGKIYFRIWDFPSQVCMYVCIAIHVSYSYYVYNKEILLMKF